MSNPKNHPTFEDSEKPSPFRLFLWHLFGRRVYVEYRNGAITTTRIKQMGDTYCVKVHEEFTNDWFKIEENGTANNSDYESKRVKRIWLRS